MTININIKANVNNLTLPEIYDLLSLYSKDKKDIIEFKGYTFMILAEVNMSIDYVITELITTIPKQ